MSGADLTQFLDYTLIAMLLAVVFMRMVCAPNALPAISMIRNNDILRFPS